MEFVATGWCTGKWLRLYQTIRNLTSGDTGIPLVVIRPEVTGLEKNRVVYLLDLSEGRRVNGPCDLVRLERFWMIGLMAVMLMSYSRVVSVVLVLSEVGLHTKFPALFSFRNSARNISKDRAHCSYLRPNKFLFISWNNGNLVISKGHLNLIKYFTNKIKLIWFYSWNIKFQLTP